MELSSYDKGLAVKSAFLLQFRGETLSGETLVRRMEERSRELSLEVPEFDFRAWVQTTLWGLLETLASAGFIAFEATQPRTTAEWSVASLRLSPHGESFLQHARDEAPYVFELIAPKVARRAAAG